MISIDIRINLRESNGRLHISETAVRALGGGQKRRRREGPVDHRTLKYVSRLSISASTPSRSRGKAAVPIFGRLFSSKFYEIARFYNVFLFSTTFATRPKRKR